MGVFESGVRVEGGGGEAGIHTHYRSEQEEEEEGVYGGDPGAQLFFMGIFYFYFLKSGEVTGGPGSGGIQ